MRTGDFIMLHASAENAAREFAQLVIVDDGPKATITTQLMASADLEADNSLPPPARAIRRQATLTLATAHFSHSG